MKKQNQYTIATLGSHSALQILKGAKDEGFKTLLITTIERKSLYERFPFIDEIKIIKNYQEFPKLEKELQRKKTIIIPHGSFVAYLGIEGNKKINIPYFGSKKVLDWESSRIKQHQWLEQAKINVPEQYYNHDLDVVEYPVILKLYGATGGKGYLYAKNRKELEKKIVLMKNEKYIIQRYIIGVPIYIQFFYSPITKKIELIGIDRRYESNVDAIGRLPMVNQEGLLIEPSFVVVGNSPLMLRESLLPEAYAMAERVVKISQKLIDKKGLYGPFCLETIVTPDQKFFVIEISTRIVAGTFLYQQGSPYTWLLYDEPMSMGRRIAREIKIAIQQKKLNRILD